MKRFAFVPLLALILTACGSLPLAPTSTNAPATQPPTLNVPTFDPNQGPTEQQPTETAPDSPTPPAVWLTDINGARQQGQLGTYCWSSDTAGICADYIWPPADFPIVTVAGGAAIHIEFDEPLPSRFTVTLWDRAGQGTLTDSGERLPEGSFYDWPSGASPGEYLLVVQSFWDAGGDSMVIFGLTIQ
jgi:hypothetical protein